MSEKVESNERGRWGRVASRRFSSPLIEPDVPISGIRLLWGCLCQGERHAIFVVLVMSFHSFVRPAPRAPSSRPHVSSTVARSGSQGRRFFRAAEGSLSLTDASAAAGCQRSGVGRAMIRGEPAVGRDQSREPRLYSVEPVRGTQTMKQSYASAGKAPRRRVHSLSGIAAIAECGLPPPRIVIGYRRIKRQDPQVVAREWPPHCRLQKISTRNKARGLRQYRQHRRHDLSYSLGASARSWRC